MLRAGDADRVWVVQLWVVREGVDAAVEVVAVRVERWQLALDGWRRATVRRDRLVARAAQDVVRATGGLGVRRWEAACRRRRIHTAADAAVVARAVRARPAVGAAVRTEQRVRATEDAAVTSARVELAAASRAVVELGRLAEQLTGLDSAELAWLARTPAAPSAGSAA